MVCMVSDTAAREEVSLNGWPLSLFCLYSAALIVLFTHLVFLIQTSQSGGQPYSDTSPYKMNGLCNSPTKIKPNDNPNKIKAQGFL